MMDKNISSGLVRAGANVKGRQVYEDLPEPAGMIKMDISEVKLPPIGTVLEKNSSGTFSTLTTSEIARAQGYTGDQCSNCGGSHMKIAGHCMVCEDCGTTTGCS